MCLSCDLIKRRRDKSDSSGYFTTRFFIKLKCLVMSTERVLICRSCCLTYCFWFEMKQTAWRYFAPFNKLDSSREETFPENKNIFLCMFNNKKKISAIPCWAVQPISEFFSILFFFSFFFSLTADRDYRSREFGVARARL